MKKKLIGMIILTTLAMLNGCGEKKEDTTMDKTVEVTPVVDVNPTDTEEKTNTTEAADDATEGTEVNNNYSEELYKYVYSGKDKIYEAPSNLPTEHMSCIREYVENGTKVLDYEIFSVGQLGNETIKTLTQRVYKDRIVEENPLESAVNNKEILRLPIVEGNRWAQVVEIDGQTKAMEHEIIEIVPASKDNRKRIVVKSIVRDMPEYENDIYAEVAIYEETMGLILADRKERKDKPDFLTLTRAEVKKDGSIGRIDIDSNYYNEVNR